MKNYEVIATINSDLSDDELTSAISKIKDLITSENGEITKLLDPIKKSLGYKIKGRKESFVVSFNISLSPEKVISLNEKMKKETSILRSMIVEIKKRKAIKEARTPKGKKGLSRPSDDNDSFELETNKLKVKPETQKVEMKEIDQKIEEILNE
jgi:ribosomal protein S6